MSRVIFSCVLLLFSCGNYSVINKNELEYCRDFDNKLFIFRDKRKPLNDNLAIFGGAFLPFTYSDTFDNEFFKLQIEFMEKTYYNHQILVTTNGKKYSIVRLDKFESKINISANKYQDFVMKRNLDTSNLILLDCTKTK